MAAIAISGKNNYLFLGKDSNSVIGQIIGNIKFTKQQINKWTTLLDERHFRLNKRNIAYFYMTVPNKEIVYSEYLPDDIVISEDRPICQLLNAYDKIIYPLPNLIKARKTMETFSRGETHCNDYGSYIIYLALMGEIKKKIQVQTIPYSEISFYDTEKDNPDLFIKIGVTKCEWIKYRLTRKPTSKITYTNNIFGTNRKYIYKNQNKNLPVCVMFGDSFMHPIARLMSESFSKVVACQTPYIDYGLVDEHKPDVVINEQIERFITKIPTDK